MSNYYDQRYDIFDGGLTDDKVKKSITHIILYIDKIGSDINLTNIKNAVKNINDALLTKDIHLDYNIVRNYVGSTEANKNIFNVGEKSIILSANDDVNVTVDGLVSTYSINLRSTHNRDELVDRLNTIFKPNNKIIGHAGGACGGP